MKPIQEWHGYITEINENTFISRLTDLTYSGTDEIMEIEISKVKSRKISIGDCFSLKIYKDHSRLEFEEPEPITEKDLKDSKEWASKIIKGINWK